MNTIEPHLVTEWQNLLVIAIAFGLFESAWRRWFGGGFHKLKEWWKKHIPWISERLFKHAVNIVALFSICTWVRGLTWQYALPISIFLQICFWTLTFGMYFDIGRAGMPMDEYHVKEYNKTWFAPILNWFFDEKTRYTPFYDYCGMMIRFTWPLLFVFFLPTFNSGMLFIGPLVALAYGLGWTLYEKGQLKKVGPTELGEWVSGAIFGLYMVLCGTI